MTDKGPRGSRPKKEKRRVHVHSVGKRHGHAQVDVDWHPGKLGVGDNEEAQVKVKW